MKIIPIQFLFILISLSACDRNTQKDDSADNKKHHETTTTQNVNAIAKSIDKNCRSIFQDKKGNYWFGTNAAGVYRYDTKELVQFTVKDGLADNQVIFIQEDELGNIWFESGNFAVSKFDGSKITNYTKNNNFKKSNGAEINWKSNPNDLWFYAGDGVFKYDNTDLTHLPFDSKPKNTTPFTLSRTSVYCTLKDKKGNVWFGTQAMGVCRFDGKSLTWFTEKGLAGPAVLGLFEDSRGTLWFGNNGAGLFRYDGNSLVNVTEEMGLGNPDFRTAGKPSSGTLARVYSINEDNLGNIWIGTVDAGVWKYDGNTMTNYTSKDGLKSNAVNTIYRDNDGELWFGTDSSGIFKFNGRTFTPFVIQ